MLAISYLFSEQVNKKEKQKKEENPILKWDREHAPKTTLGRAAAFGGVMAAGLAATGASQ